jgi:cation diffusion facilitator family transporter
MGVPGGDFGTDAPPCRTQVIDSSDVADQPPAQEESKKAIVAAFFANVGIAIAKLVAFGFTGAASMLAEAVHSLADTGNQGLLLFGRRRARRPADREHPFGFGRERYFWAFVVAVILFTVGSVFAIVEAIEKLLHPHELESAGWAIATLLVAIVLESFSFRTALKEVAHEREGRSLWRFIVETKSPDLPVVVLEDSGALVGLMLALVGILLAMVTGNPRFDALGSLGIGLLLGVIAIVLALQMKSLLIGESARGDVLDAIRRRVEDGTRVRRLYALRTEHLGPDELLVAAKIDLDPELTFAEVAAEIDAAEARVRAEVPEARIIYFEPDVFRPQI